MFEEYDVVKLLENTVVEWDDELVPLTAGCSGTILAVSQEQNSYLVEFTDDEGESLAMVPIAERLLELVWQASTRSYVDSGGAKTID
ncbi:MAG: DUF4926 domain-containing protein [Candidatus Obscuribacter sp.]|jgi:hypothetical protein|nr:DUF4926 domain-containing protein [Candidatus Obscuribacter sp.]MBK9769862.1 DUF4926 domain-containing protein [Candidatus Obscuribacter sp.]MBL0184249.1 DUF4926 domain-containing protein [Candidatus Obscuribacter sp.]MDQ5966926.1 hypothetical protein [Cyanobacteriota bacterium erpe_2018_sw_39hr_WHONDRS-SW48-000098_B_bin.30]